MLNFLKKKGKNLKFKKKSYSFNIKHHDNPFKPSNPNKKGPMGTLDKFPKYMENPLKEAKR